MAGKIRWCSLCDEIEATHASKTLCHKCYHRVLYWRGASPTHLMERRENLKLYLRTNSIMIGDHGVTDIEDERDKKNKVA